MVEVDFQRQNELRWAVQRTDDDRMNHVGLLAARARSQVGQNTNIV